MKPFSILVLGFGYVVATGASVKGVAPLHSGIYLSAADYKGRRLTAEGDCGSKGHKIELHDLLDKAYIHVTHGSETVRYEKSGVFGFRACDGRDYRFGSNLEYQIVAAQELYIYLREQWVGGKNRHIVRTYYFSAGSDGRVLPLTIKNLKEAFPENYAFHDRLDQAFGRRRDIAQYDDDHKMFKVNRLLTMASTEP